MIKKTMISMVGGILLMSLASQAMAEIKYFMADNVEVKASLPVENGQTSVLLEYDRPCWADFVQVGSVTDVLGSPVNPAADFKVALSVTLKERNDTHLCNMMEPAVSRESAGITVNTNAIEGKFLGLEIVQASQPEAR